MTELYERVKWHPGMSRYHEELWFSEFFKNAEERKRKERIARNAEDGTLKVAFGKVSLLVTGIDRKNKSSPEPWLPEYDNLILSFWTPKELKDFVAEGFNKEQLVRHTKKYLIENAWKMDHWKRLSKEEYTEEVRRDPAYHLLEIVHFKDSKRGIPLTEWGYSDLNDKKINREELLGIKAPRPSDEMEQSVKREFEKKNGIPVQGYTVDVMLYDSVMGKQSLNILGWSDYAVDFAPLGLDDSALVPAERRLTLNQNFSNESNALSVVKVACRLKHKKHGAEPTSQMDLDTYMAAHVACNADILSSQLVYAQEMRHKNPKILETFRENGNEKMCDKFEESFAKSKDLNKARSEAIDHYLEKTLPLTEARRANMVRNWSYGVGSRDKSLTAKEVLGNACKGFDGKTYYNGKNATNDKLDVRKRLTLPESQNRDYTAFLSVLKARGR